MDKDPKTVSKPSIKYAILHTTIFIQSDEGKPIGSIGPTLRAQKLTHLESLKMTKIVGGLECSVKNVRFFIPDANIQVVVYGE